MKRYFLPILYIAALLLTACHDDHEVRARRTVVVYMMAENSLSRYAQSDIAEMVLASGQVPLDCNLVVYLDNADMPSIMTINSTQGKSVWKKLNEQNSTDPTVLQKNLQTILRQFPAEHYGLVLWSHGSGWVPAARKTIGVDNNINSGSYNVGSELEIPDLRGVLEHCGVHWDYILMDACNMQCVEVAYELRKLTDWCISSPTEIPAAGAPYDLILHGLMEGDAQEIVEQYYSNYGELSGLVISAVQCNQLEALAQATRKIVPTLFADHREVSTSGIQPYSVWNEWTAWHPEYFDMGSAMAQLASVDAYSQWWETAQKAVPYKLASDTWNTSYEGFDPTLIDPLHWLGMSMFIPLSKYDEQGYNTDFRQTSWYKAAGWDQTGW